MKGKFVQIFIVLLSVIVSFCLPFAVVQYKDANIKGNVQEVKFSYTQTDLDNSAPHILEIYGSGSSSTLVLGTGLKMNAEEAQQSARESMLELFGLDTFDGEETFTLYDLINDSYVGACSAYLLINQDQPWNYRCIWDITFNINDSEQISYLNVCLDESSGMIMSISGTIPDEMQTYTYDIFQYYLRTFSVGIGD